MVVDKDENMVPNIAPSTDLLGLILSISFSFS